MSRKTMLAVTVAISVLVLWWMFGLRAAPETPAAASPSPAASAQPSTVVVPANSATPQPSTATATGAPTREPDPSLSAKERAQVAAFATRFMKAFARPTTKTSARVWWERVAKDLTDDAIDLYAGITPDQVRFTKVTGPAVLQPVDAASDAFWIQPVTVPTNGGVYTLLVQLPSSGFGDRLQVLEIQEP